MTTPTSNAPRILYVDDEATAVKYFRRAAESLAPVATAGSADEGKRLLDEHAATLAVLVSDQRMPGGYGNELLQYAHSRYPHIVRILTTAYSELDNTIEAVNQGQIYRYIQKPWDLPALRMELKQAIDLATLRQEHAQLLREKMMVRQMQTLSNRIGALHSLCASLAGPEQPSPLESYLSAAAAIGVQPAAPDWLTMDYSDLVSAESYRTSRFALAVRHKLDEMRKQHPAGGNALALLPQLAGVSAGAMDGDSMLIVNAHNIAEFLQTPSDAQPSAEHAAWLAYLLWLHGTGQSLKISRLDTGLQCKLAAPVPLTPARLADWISQFCDMQRY